MSCASITFQGEHLLLDPAGGLVWPARRLLAVADLHLEKGSAAAAKGSLLPPWDTRTTLDRLAGLLRRHRPAEVVALGDSFHDARGAGRLLSPDQARLAAMTGFARFTWVLGNHDPTPPEGIGGTATDQHIAGPLRFRHEAGSGSLGELCGHHHPKAHIPTKGARVTRPCFVLGAARLMLPAIGAYTGGLDVHDPAIARLFPGGGRLFLLGQHRLFAFTYAPRPAIAAPLAASLALL